MVPVQNIWNRMPFSVRRRLLMMFGFLLAGNLMVWAAAFAVSREYPVVLGLVALAYGLGLRHAVDADHIAAIDNATRKLMLEGQRPVGVGLFFSLGHSSVVLLFSVAMVFFASFVTHHLTDLQDTGSLIGASVSSLFLFVVGMINLIVLIELYRVWRRVSRGGTYDEQSLEELLNKRGLMARILRPFLRVVRKSWHLYIVGFLFGLGLDTAIGVALLSLSAMTVPGGMPFGVSLLLPLAFAAGMVLVDALDGALMLGAYGWASLQPMRKLYYNMNITFLSVMIAWCIASVQALQTAGDYWNIEGSFFGRIREMDFGQSGYVIIAVFVVSWMISAGLSKRKGSAAREREE